MATAEAPDWESTAVVPTGSGSGRNVASSCTSGSVFATPKTARGWEGLLRFDHMKPNKALTDQVRERTIAGVAYWFPHQGNVSAALLFDVDNATFDNFTPAQPAQKRIAVHGLVNF